MLLRHLKLTNIKCFAPNTVIDFTVGKRPDEAPHRWVVVYGDNGLGKSTLLRSIAVALTGQPAMNHLLPSAEGWVRGRHKTAEIGAEFTRNDARAGEGDVMTGQRKKPFDISWTIVGGGRPSSISREVAGPGSIVLSKPGSNDARLFQSYVATDQPRRGWLLCGYGPHRRLTGASSDMAEKFSPDGRAARLVTLFHEKAALTSAERWLIGLDHEAQKTRDLARLNEIRAILDHGLLHDGVKLSTIQPDGVLFSTPFGGDIPMSDLSDGYRTSLSLALDLLRHISYCFEVEKLMNVDDTGRVSVGAEGVVLIDEIDSHLHPMWQRTIGNWLCQTFPKIQFIVTTHSPLIPERVSREEGMVVRLKRRAQGHGQVVVADCERTTSRSLTADQNLTSKNFGLASTRDVLVDALLEKIRVLSSRVRSGKANTSDRKELKDAQLELTLTAPPVGLPIESR